VGFGEPDTHASLLADVRGRLAPAFEFATPMPYVALQSLLDEANGWGLHCYDKGCYVDALSDDVIDVLTTHFPKKASPLSLTLFYRLDGAFSAVAEDATAFSGGRSARFGVFIIGACPVAEMLPAERDWVRGMAEAFAPLASDGTYINAVTDFDSINPVEQAYGAEKYTRLAEIKTRYDPTNVFHRNANIAPH